ncbi:MAG: hypothetical protein RID91_01405, partial [Azospirillaceae bacterium]
MTEPPTGPAPARPGGGNAAAPGAATAPVRAAVTALPDGLAARAAAGASAGAERALTLSGTLGAARPDGTASLRTASGDVTLKLPADGAARQAAGRTVSLTLVLTGG